MDEIIRISKEETRKILYLNKQNRELLENPQSWTPHAITITGIMKKDTNDKLVPRFILRSKPSEKAKAVKTTASNYIRVMVYPENIDKPLTINGKIYEEPTGKPQPFNVFESGRPDLYAMLKKDILAKNYNITSSDTDEIPTANVHRLFPGKIVTINVPAYKLVNRASGDQTDFQGPRLDRYTGNYKEQVNTSTHCTFFVDSDTLKKGQLESFVISLMEDRISPYFINKKYTLTLIDDIVVDQQPIDTKPKEDDSEENLEKDIEDEEASNEEDDL